MSSAKDVGLFATTKQNVPAIFKSKNIIEEYFLPDIGKEVKFDIPIKTAAFVTALSAILQEPMNLFFKGQSGVGKTYIVKKTLEYFPQENIRYLGGLSPTALVHEHGILMNKQGNPIDLDSRPEKPDRKMFKTDEEFRKAKEDCKKKVKEWNTELATSYTLINLKNKLLFFLETPDQGAFDRLLPILSHDKEQIEFNFTDKTAKGKFRTAKVVIQGFPATIFLTVDKKLNRMEELATRSFTATPESSEDKIEAANKVTTHRSNYPWEKTHETKERKQLKELLLSLKLTFLDEDFDIVIPFDNLAELYPHEMVRDMRDYDHFLQFIKTFTALHIHQRAIIEVEGKKYAVASIFDVEIAFKIFGAIFETTRTSADKALLDFYWEYVSTTEGCSIRQFVGFYNVLNKTKKGYNTIAQYLEKLEKKGYVDKQQDENDRRRYTYNPLKKKKDELLYNPLEHENKVDLSTFLKTGYELWLNDLLKGTLWYIMSNNANENELTLNKVSEAEAREKILC